MNKTSTLDRRALLRRIGGGLGLLVIAPVTTAVQGCGKRALNCADSAGLSFADAQTRVTLEYRDRATDPAKICRGCKHFRSAGEESCGACDLVKGPINPIGGCKSWEARA